MSHISRKEAIDNYQYLNELFINVRKDINNFLSDEMFKINHTSFKSSIIKNIKSNFDIVENKNNITLLILNKFIEFDIYEGIIFLYSLEENIDFLKESINNQINILENKIDTRKNVIETMNRNNKKYNRELEDKNNELYEKIKLGSLSNALLNLVGMNNSFKLKKEINELKERISSNEELLDKNNKELNSLQKEKDTISKYDFRFANKDFIMNKINDFLQYFKNEYGFEFYIKYEGRL